MARSLWYWHGHFVLSEIFFIFLKLIRAKVKMMKTFLTALAGGVVGAAMVLAVQSGKFVKEAHAVGAIPNDTICYVENMIAVHTETSAKMLLSYCNAKNG